MSGPQLMSGGSAGSATGEGFVYVMKNGQQFKFGCSKDPDERLKQIRSQEGHEDTTLVEKFSADQMRDAETAAQQAVKDKLGMTKVARTATDWFNNPNNATEKEIIEVVKRAVSSHNRKNKPKK